MVDLVPRLGLVVHSMLRLLLLLRLKLDLLQLVLGLVDLEQALVHLALDQEPSFEVPPPSLAFAHGNLQAMKVMPIDPD